MEAAAQYAIVRFAPFPETGEFANIGVVLACPELGFLDGKLLKTKIRRILGFFSGLDRRVFQSTVGHLDAEITRVQARADRSFKSAFQQNLLPDLYPSIADLFTDLTNARQGIVQFSARRTVLTQSPDETLATMYQHYVERSFRTLEYEDALLERAVRQQLVREHLDKRFRRHVIGTPDYHFQFPFVELRDDKPIKVIKPLNLRHDTASDIIDSGGHWVDRLRRLKKRQSLPDQVLFTVRSPMPEPALNDAYEGILQELVEQGIQVRDESDVQGLLTFARRPIVFGP